MIKLRPIEQSDLEQIRKWRQGKGYMLRTESDITEHSQRKWYEDVVSNRNSKIKFWAIYASGDAHGNGFINLLGYCSLDFDFINGYSELGLLIGDEYQRKGYGMQVVSLLVKKAFDEYRMKNIVYECYACNPAFDFWMKVGSKYGALTCSIPKRKYWKSNYHNSLYGVIGNA